MRKSKMAKNICSKLIEHGTLHYEEVIAHDEKIKADALRRSNKRGL